ncbi:MAG: polysaccharide deacetylase family protein [Salinivirgaceae bacterium]
MNEILNHSRIDYVLYHLYQNCSVNDKLYKCFIFNEIIDNDNLPCVFFPLSNRSFNLNDVFSVDNIPLLFPMSNIKSFYRFEGNSLYFEHDLFKSAFYLLSGYQEYNSTETDVLGRFPYEKSIQEQLNIVEKPIVNYYFEIIISGLEEFCKRNQISFSRRYLFDNYGFFLTHDVDKIDQINLRDGIFKIKQLLKLAPAKVPYSRLLKANLGYLFKMINLFNKENSFWNFAKMHQIEQELGLRSAWYFLPNDSPLDSYYSFSEPRIGELVEFLETNGHEIGIHGTIKSAENAFAMQIILKEINSLTHNKVTGGRQHRLMFSMPQTLLIHEQLGLKYDSTLGFAAHEGFRNSYCLPFKLYDFATERMIDVWEFPLIVMDGTLFSYRQLSADKAMQQLNKLIDEVRKFHGLFTLL